MFSQFYQVQSSPALDGMSDTQLKELISKLKHDNSTFESEIIKLKCEISNSLNSQNELKSKNLELEKELHQSRLQHKLKISQLQKEISSLSSGTPPSERNRSASATPPPQQPNALTVQTASAPTAQTASSATQSIVPVSQSTATQCATAQLHAAPASASQSTATQAAAPFIETQSIAVQVDSLTSQTPKIHDAPLLDHTNDVEPSKAQELVIPSSDIRPSVATIATIASVAMVDAQFQTEEELIHSEKSKKEEDVKKVKEDLKREMEEKIMNLRNAHKENIDSLSVQIQELRADLKNSDIIKKKLEDANKTLEESMMDLQSQVEILREEKDNTREKFQEYEKNREENEEKIKKMKGLLIAANKKLIEYKELTGNLRNELKEANEKKQEISGNEEELTRKMQEVKERYEDKIHESLQENEKQRGITMEKDREIDNLTQENDKIHQDFQDYKVKAQLALQQSTNSNRSEGRILELEELNLKSENQIARLESDILNLNGKISHLENKLRESISSNQTLSDKLSDMQKNSKERFHLQQDLDSMRKAIEQLKLSHQQEMDDIKKEHQDRQETLKQEIQKLQSDATTSLDDYNQKMVEYSNATQNLKAELAQARNQIEQLKTSSGPGPLNTSRPSSPFIEKQLGMHSPPLRRSSSNLLNNLDPGGVSSFKVKEMAHKIDQLSLLLTESEANVERLLEQEKFLKEQLRTQDRIEVLEKRLSIEYLKNIVLSFFESKSKESLIPVLARVLELSPEEEQKLHIIPLPNTQVLPSRTFGILPLRFTPGDGNHDDKFIQPYSDPSSNDGDNLLSNPKSVSFPMTLNLDERKYTVTGFVAQGADGTVYEGNYQDGDQTKQVIFKVYTGGYFFKHLSIEYFNNEKHALEKLGRLIDADDKHLILVMQKITGITLTELVRNIRTNMSQDDEETLRLLLAEYLRLPAEFRKKWGLVHMDIHPSNVIVDKSGEMVLIDFAKTKVQKENVEESRLLANLDDLYAKLGAAFHFNIPIEEITYE